MSENILNILLPNLFESSKVRLMKITILILLSLSLSFSSLFAKEKHNSRIDELFEILSYQPNSFDPTGAVCERVAEIELLAQYPASNYKIISGIEYQNKVETIGELDLVILDLQTNRVETVYEVKCWKSYKNGLRKAREQRLRFVNQLNYDIKIIDKNKNTYSKEIFSQIREFQTVSQLGGVQEGFDVELSLDLKDLMKLRSRLLDCYAVAKCPRIK